MYIIDGSEKTMPAGLIAEGDDGGSGRSVRVKSTGSYSEPNLVLT